MSKRIALLLCLVLSLPLLAQEKPKDTSANNNVYRLDFTITELEGTKKLVSRNYSMLIGEGRNARLRVGNKLPISTGSAAGAEQFQYMDVGANIDATPWLVDGSSLRLVARLDVSTMASMDQARRPVLRNFNNAVEAVIPLDKLVLLTSQDEPGTSTTFQVSVIAKIVK